MKQLKSHKHTILASYFGYITQAIVNNFAPLLFLTFSKNFGLSIEKITFFDNAEFLRATARGFFGDEVCG